MEKRPLSVVVPSYNHEKYIEETLKNLIKIKNCKQIIVIDDNSKDNTVKVVKNFKKQHADRNIKLIEKKKNEGLVSSLNIGLNMIDTEFVYFIASDDIPIPENIDKLVNYMIQKPNLNYVIAGALNYFENNSILTSTYTEKHMKFFLIDEKDRFEKLFLDYPNPLLIQSTIFRTNILKTIGGWDKNIFLDDYQIFVKLLSKYGRINRDFEFKPDIIIVKYRHHPNNTYKNVFYQYNLVKNAILNLAPQYLINKATGYSIGYYLLVSIKQKRYKDLLNIIRDISFKNFHHVFYNISKIVIKKFIGK
ncbi:glycosyltransferase [Persephonella sp.]